MILSAVESCDGKEVEIKWEDGHFSRFHTIWLRYNCQCGTCHRKLINELTIDRTKIPKDLIATACYIKEPGRFYIEIKDDVPVDHKTELSSAWLREHCYCDACLQHTVEVTSSLTFPDPSQHSITTFEYKDVAEGPALNVFRWLDNLILNGFNLVKNVPREHGTVVKLAEIVCPVLYQTYGKLFEVFDDGSISVFSNTNKGLHYHMDQPQYESAPGVQFLHAMKPRFDECVSGGESLIVDMFQCAEILRKESEENFRVLCTVPTVWKTVDVKMETPKYFQIRKTILETDYDNQLVAIHWNPGTEEAIQVRHDDVTPFYTAYRHFWKILHREDLRFKFRLQPGDCLVFNNRRVAHTRTGFEHNGGERFLQGAYINLDEMRSKYISLGLTLGEKVRFTKIGNRSCI
ncbi:gamma-butyrobetaine dioxygenase-like [Ciona intestinalis]